MYLQARGGRQAPLDSTQRLSAITWEWQRVQDSNAFECEYGLKEQVKNHVQL